jgi:DNA invertase Pin-like site-specific DNA recombinase
MTDPTRAERSRLGLAAAKARGVRLGNPDLTGARRAAAAANVAKAAGFRAAIRPLIESIRASGIVSLWGIARELNRRGVTGPNGGSWAAQSVKNALT